MHLHVYIQCPKKSSGALFSLSILYFINFHVYIIFPCSKVEKGLKRKQTCLSGFSPCFFGFKTKKAFNGGLLSPLKASNYVLPSTPVFITVNLELLGIIVKCVFINIISCFLQSRIIVCILSYFSCFRADGSAKWHN